MTEHDALLKAALADLEPIDARFGAAEGDLVGRLAAS